MVREKMITRTIIETEAKVLCLNIATCEASFSTFKIGGKWEYKEQLQSKLQELYNTDEFKLVDVQEWSETEVLLGMSVEDFMRYAKVLPPRAKAEVEE